MRRPRSFLRPALTLALVLPVAGCAHSNSPSDARADRVPQARAAVESIVLCKTTEGELRRMLGPPTRDGKLHGQRIVSWIVQWDSPARYLAVLVDARGVVVDAYWDVPTEVPWTPADQCTR